MEIILKTKTIDNTLGTSFLFGLKDLSTEEYTLSIEEIKNIDTSNIYISIDKNIFNRDLEKLEKSLIELNKLNIKGIFFYDLAVVQISKKLNIKVPLIWNQNFLVTNYRTCNYYQKEGVEGALLSSEITIEEIKNISKKTNLKLFINIFGYNLMAFSKRKLITNYFKHINEKNTNKVNYMIEKAKKYPILENEIGTKIYTENIICGIRYLNILKENNINHIIINDILLPKEIYIQIINIFKQAINEKISDEKLIELENKIKEHVKIDLGFFEKETIYKVKKND